jgi:hypothetical protein
MSEPKRWYLAGSGIILTMVLVGVLVLSLRPRFVVGGKNPTALFSQLTKINGKSIEELEGDAPRRIVDRRLSGQGRTPA